MFSALRERNFAYLFTAQAISLVGDFMLFIALPFWIYQVTGSVTATGIMFAALTLPQLFLSPIAGVFVDRLDRKKVMIASDLIRAAIMFAYLTINSADQVWIVYVLAFAESCVSQFFRPSVMAVVPTIMPEDKLTQANAALGATQAIGQLGGPALGGVLAATFGLHGVALVDGASYIISALLIALMHIPHTEHAAPKEKTAGQAVEEIGRELVQGVRVVWGRPILRIVFAAFGVMMLSNGIFNVLLVVLVKDLWHVTAIEFGWVMSAQAIGVLVGTVIIGAIAHRITPRMLIVWGGIIVGALLVLMVNQTSVYVAMALMLPLGMTVVAFDVGGTTLMQIGSDDANRGRVASLLQTVIAIATMISTIVASTLASQIGVSVLLNFAAASFIAGGLIALLLPNIKLENPPTPVPQPAE